MQFYSSALGSNYTIPPIEEEIQAYRVYDHTTLWPAQSNFSRQWVYKYKKDDLRARVAVTTLINHAHFLWRKGERVPRIYPAENNVSFFPDKMICLMNEALELDWIQGIDERGKLITQYFIHYGRHEHFIKFINRFIATHWYTATALQPGWRIPSHMNQQGMDEDTATRASLLYRAEVELLLYDLLNIRPNRTSQSLLENPDVLYRLRGPLWRGLQEWELSTSRVTNINLTQIRIPKATNLHEDIVINMPELDSEEFQQVKNDLSKIPKVHRKELAATMGYTDKKKRKRLTDIHIPATVRELPEDRTYDPHHFTMMSPLYVPLHHTEEMTQYMAPLTSPTHLLQQPTLTLAHYEKQ